MSASKPLNEKVKDFLPQKFLHKLTPEAQDLTKGDLLALARLEYRPHVLKITVGDLKTLNDVLQKRAEGEDVGLAKKHHTTSCCCSCCPCCCCSGVATINPPRHS